MQPGARRFAEGISHLPPRAIYANEGIGMCEDPDQVLAGRLRHSPCSQPDAGRVNHCALTERGRENGQSDSLDFNQPNRAPLSKASVPRHTRKLFTEVPNHDIGFYKE